MFFNNSDKSKGGNNFSKGDDLGGERGNKTTLGKAVVVYDLVTIFA